MRKILIISLLFLSIILSQQTEVSAHTTIGDHDGTPSLFRSNDHELNPINTFGQAHVPGPLGYVWLGGGLNHYLSDPDLPPGYQSPFTTYEKPIQAAGGAYSPESAILVSLAHRDNVGDLVFAINFSQPKSFGSNPTFHYNNITLYIPAPVVDKHGELVQDGFEPVGRIDWGKGDVSNIVTTVTDNYGRIFVTKADMQDPFKPSSSGSDRHYVGTLSAGQVSEANFIIDIDENAKFGKYFAALAIEVDGESIQIGEVPIYLNEKVKFEVSGYTPTTLRVGDTGRVVRVELRNTGSVKADSVRVQLRVGSFYSGTLTDFLGTVIPGESKVAFFTIDVDSKAVPREYAFDLRLDWTQEDNPLDDTLRLSFNLEPPATPVATVILLLVAAVAVGSYLLARQRRVAFKLPRLKRWNSDVDCLPEANRE